MQKEHKIQVQTCHRRINSCHFPQKKKENVPSDALEYFP